MLMRCRRPLALAAAVLASVIAFAPGPASATAKKLTGPDLVHALLSSKEAKQLGFPQVANKARFGHSTGFKYCALGSQVVYQNTKKVKGLIDVLYACPTKGYATDFFGQLAQQYPSTPGFTPPSSLGTGAVGNAVAPMYLYMWQRGPVIALVAVNTDASNNKDISREHRFDLFTPKLESDLKAAAIKQDKAVSLLLDGPRKKK